MKLPTLQILIEQLALLFASLIWTVVILAGVCIIWVYQDIQDRQEFIASLPPEALAQAPTLTPFPTPTVWEPPSTATPTATMPPTPTATWVVLPPDLLPETLNPDDPTPVVQNSMPEATRPENTIMPVEITETPTHEPVSESVEVAPQPTTTPTLGMEIALVGTPTATVQPTTPAISNQESHQSNIPTHLTIPSVGIDSDVVTVGWDILEQGGQQYSVWQVADYAVGWHQTSAPLGQVGNTVMAGHHNMNGEVFRDLVNVEVGDRVTLQAGDQIFEYEVTLKTIVKEKGESLETRKENAQWISPADDERITLVTCWPYTNNTHRVIVIAKPI
jgi:sortase A